ncbi:MAG: hypothetical protein IT328_21930 [Caldilineaceae bacterium]|nr:hypothetical protein [Caldilineaceae bacterium]
MTLFRVRDSYLFRCSRALCIAPLLALLTAFMATPVQAAIRYVRPDTPNTLGCSTPATACNTIPAAITAADPGDEIRVAKGSYSGQEITVNKQLTVIGGFDPDGPGAWETSTYTLTPSILDGEDLRRPLAITVAGVVVENFTVRNGNATSSILFPHIGGGIVAANISSVTLRGLTVMDNTASTTDPNSTGGGVAFLGIGTINIERTLILSNTTTGSGGGIGIRPNAAQLGVLNVHSSVIAHNSALQGGAIATSGAGQSAVSTYHTTIADNNQGAATEAIFMTGGNSEPAPKNSLAFSYSLLTGNTTGVNIATPQTPVMLQLGVIMDPNVTTDWAGTLPAINPALRRTLLFVNPTAGDYHLVAGSPAIDIAGNTAKVDLEGRQRVNSANCTPFTLCPLGRSDDYGAYEYVNTAPAVRYVATEGSDSLNNCLNPALPCLTPENANKIALGGDEIRLAQGTYTDGDFTCTNAAVLCVRQGITLTGGFTTTNWITPSTNPAFTTLDGQTARQGIQVDYDLPSAGALIQNLTVRNGYSLGRGGGIAINTNNIGPAQNLTIRNCRVENSRGDGDGDGGGIFALSPVNLSVENCTLSGNSVPDGRGGGLAITDANGTATYTLTKLIVFENIANRPNDASANGGRGGGLFLEGIGTLRQSEVYSNSASFTGGGVSTGSNKAHPTIDRVYIHDNQAGIGGGFSIFLTGGANLQNSLLVRNVATSTVGLLSGQTPADPMVGGNAIHTPYIGSPDEPLRVINVTIADNNGAVPEAVKVEGSANLPNTRVNAFTNVLISGSEIGIKSDGEGVASLQKVLITNDVTTKTGGFAVDRLTGTPLDGIAGYVGGGDYHLVPGADGVDDGDTIPGITQDLDGTSRPVGPAFDIGAYETTLQKQNQSITFAALPNRALAESPFTAQATASSGLPVQLESLTPAICTLSGNTVTLIAEGTCSIRASQPGNPAFNPAQPVTRSFEVGVTVPPELLHLPVLSK